MKYMLDTNICIYIINKHPEQVIKRFSMLPKGVTEISSVVLSELAFGANKSQLCEKNLQALSKFTIPVSVIPYDDAAAYLYGKLRADLSRKGKLIGQLDMMIAAHAISVNAILVTNNLKEFSRIKSLKCENWI